MQERSRSQLIRKTFQLACIPDVMQSLVECTAEVARPNNWSADAPSPAVEHEQPQEIGRKGSGKEERSRRSGQHVKQRKRSSIGELILTNHQVELSPRYSIAGFVIKLGVFAPQLSVIRPPMQLGAALDVLAYQKHRNRIVPHMFSFLCVNRQGPLSEGGPKRGLLLVITFVKAELRS
jgi:hypothetical protein